MLIDKKFILILCIFILSGLTFAYAEDEVYLDLGIPQSKSFDTGKLDFGNVPKSDDEDENYLKPSLQSMKKMFDEDFYQPKTISSKKEKKFGKTTVGSKTDTKFETNNLNSTNTLYAKQQLTEKMSVDTSYKTGGLKDFNDNKGTVSVAPEYQLHPKTKIRNIYSKDLNNNNTKQEVQLNYTPFKDGRMDMNAGVGQVQRDNGAQSSSQVNFGTNIRF